jgi:hypothetical protein
MAAARVGRFPAEKVSRKRNGLAVRHAQSAWETARTGAINRSWGLWSEVERDQRSFLGQIDLAFLATLAGHMRRCEDCWADWIDGEVPGELLTEAVRRIPAWEIFRALVKEIRAQRPGR